MPLILSGNVASATADADVVTNSCRFDGTSAYMGLTLGTPTNNKIYTFSAWVKRSKLGQYGCMLNAGSSRDCFRFRGDNDHLHFFTGDATTGGLETNRVFRDPSAWLHLVCAVDTTQATDTNRVKLYVNGVQETSFTNSDYPAQDYTNVINSAVENRIGKASNIYDEYFGGYMAEAVFIDGQQLTPTSFGEYDEDSPTIWKPIDVSGLTFGDNGFYLDFEASDNLGNDANGGSDFSETNLDATDQATDTPTNNFATLNPVDAHTTSPTFVEGNLDFHAPSGTAFTPSRATIAVSKGKWYVEFKATTASATLGACSTQSPMDDHMRDSSDVRSIYRLTGGYWYGQNNGGAIDDQGDNSETFTDDDICMCALDMDNGYFYFGINGTWVNGQDGSTTGDPAGNNGGSGGAGNPSSQLLTNQHDGVYTFFAMDGSTAGTGQLQANFGNPPYTISSGNADADGYGNFEYAVPSGFYALCTKNLAEYG
jgi:hypothetical protein